MRALIDTNVLLDLVLDRAPFVEDATAIWEACRTEQFVGYVSAISPLDVFYVVRRARDASIARQAVEDILAVFDICSVDGDSLKTALTCRSRISRMPFNWQVRWSINWTPS